MVEDFPELGSAQLVALPCCVFGRTPRGWDYPESELIHGMLSPLQESGRLLSHRLCRFRVSGAPSNNKGWKSRYLFVTGLNWRFRLDWSAHPIGNIPPYLCEEEFVLVGRLKGILSSSCAIKEMTELWLVEEGLSPASRGIISFTLILNLRDVFLTCGSGGKLHVARAAASAREIDIPPTIEAPKASSKSLIDASTPQTDDPARRHKKVKILSRRHKFCHGIGLTPKVRKEPAVPVEELEMPIESAEEAASPVFHRPRSMKDLCGTKVRKDDIGYYALYMSDLAHQDPDKEMHARWEKLKNSTKIWNDLSVAEEFERGLLHPQLVRELYTLSSEVLLARAAKEMVLVIFRPSPHFLGLFSDSVLTTVVLCRINTFKWHSEEHASELEKELERMKHERDEALQRLETSDKELNEAQ
ncbi:hypothetical protein GW17_00010914, partial [Ensete ventricosum]